MTEKFSLNVILLKKTEQRWPVVLIKFLDVEAAFLKLVKKDVKSTLEQFMSLFCPVVR